MPRLPELETLEDLLDQAPASARVHTLATVGEENWPLYALVLGNPAPEAPVLGFFGGVHGLERIGCQIVLALLRSILVRLHWDSSLQHKLERMRLVFMPLINPGGMLRGWRCNPAGIDLMRNAPLDAAQRPAWLVGGQRLSRHLPWYRGPAGAALAAENQALCQLVERELLCSPFSLALDCHSGFGLRDRLWFPYAHTRQPWPALPEVYALAELFQHSYPYHPYLIEPQARQYTTHGDIWDYLYLQHASHGQRQFLPLTLELGSWLWIKKNPRQLLSLLGLFNPIVPHRQQRVLRKHLVLFEFLIRAVHDHAYWLPRGEQRHELAARAYQYWDYRP
ncbi:MULTISPECIES: M14 family zinc carboxypeptidase [Chitinibacter]|uniref:M14 family zinc carboxypeptidase n=1 Tax=Chitinibacter TaxID=230666 RepID=UPI000646E7E2|nr:MULTISPECIES: M14 family zinc carboxypeptidase [Chitinibacter]